MEAVDDERGIGAVMLDRPGIGAAHVATGPQDASLLPLAQTFVEEAVNCLTALTQAHPQDTRTIQVVNKGGKLAALAEGYLVGTEGDQATDFMPITNTRNDPVQQIGQCRGWHFQDLGSGLLGHDLAQRTDAPFQAIGDARMGWSPWDCLLRSSVRRASNLLRCIPEQDFHAHEGEIFPPAKLGRVVHDLATPSTFRAAAAILVWHDRQMQLLVTILEPKLGDFHAFQA